MSNDLPEKEFWRDKRVIVTGGNGFLGSFIVDKLRQRGTAEVSVPRRKEYDPSTLFRAGLRDIDAIRQFSAHVHRAQLAVGMHG